MEWDVLWYLADSGETVDVVLRSALVQSGYRISGGEFGVFISELETQGLVHVDRRHVDRFGMSLKDTFVSISKAGEERLAVLSTVFDRGEF